MKVPISQEFLEQFNHFVQTMKLLHLQPEQNRQEMQSLMDTVLFLSGLAKHYPKEAKQFSDSLFELLREQGAGLDADVRMSFCKALVLLRNQDMVDPIELLNTFFELVKVEDKALRYQTSHFLLKPLVFQKVRSLLYQFSLETHLSQEEGRKDVGKDSESVFFKTERFPIHRGPCCSTRLHRRFQTKILERRPHCQRHFGSLFP